MFDSDLSRGSLSFVERTTRLFYRIFGPLPPEDLWFFSMEWIRRARR